MEKDFLEIGQIVGVQGIKGEVRVNPWSDSPSFLLEFDLLYLNNGDKEINILNSYTSKNVVIMKLEGIDTIEQAQMLKRQILFADREDMELDEGVFFIQELIGLTVIDQQNNSIEYGKIIEVTPTGSNDVYHIKSAEGKVVLIPAIAQVIKKTDIEKGIMEITPLKGLFDDED